MPRRPPVGRHPLVAEEVLAQRVGELAQRFPMILSRISFCCLRFDTEFDPSGGLQENLGWPGHHVRLTHLEVEGRVYAGPSSHSYPVQLVRQ